MAEPEGRQRYHELYRKAGVAAKSASVRKVDSGIRWHRVDKRGKGLIHPLYLPVLFALVLDVLQPQPVNDNLSLKLW